MQTLLRHSDRGLEGSGKNCIVDHEIPVSHFLHAEGTHVRRKQIKLEYLILLGGARQLNYLFDPLHCALSSLKQEEQKDK